MALAIVAVSNLLPSAEPGRVKGVNRVPLGGIKVRVLGVRELMGLTFCWGKDVFRGNIRAVAILPLHSVEWVDAGDWDGDDGSLDVRGLAALSGWTFWLYQYHVSQGVGGAGFRWGGKHSKVEPTIIEKFRD
ncbi:MAG: hypothetical protein ACRCYW_20135 [Aeromonas sp.]|uniref:hypothetical protein n=1 Tax=Aeromonas sp. TaxID=647 RepID=UPI003F2DEC8C